MKGVLIFYYLGGAGGKFIANCLTYSGQVAFPNYEVALRHDLKEYNQLLLETIPTREDSRSWLTREHGCWQLFGDATMGIKEQGSVNAGVKQNDLTLLDDVWVPIMAHHLHEVHNIQRYFKDVPQRLIIVDARDDFIDLAIRLKWENPMACLDLDRYDDFKEKIKTLDPDYVFEDWDPRDPGAIERIIEFAYTLGIDLNLTPAQEYIKKYQDFHQF